MPDVLVWFDGACPLCRREIAWMRRLDRRNAIAFVDVSQEAAAPDGGAACPIDRSTLLARFHALEDGQVVSGAAAFAAMWRAVPLLRPLGPRGPQPPRAGGAGAAVRPVPPRAAPTPAGGPAVGRTLGGVTAKGARHPRPPQQCGEGRPEPGEAAKGPAGPACVPAATLRDRAAVPRTPRHGPAPRPQTPARPAAHSTPSSSTSNTSVAPGGITPPAPRAP
jgi:hypothetical protein